MLQKGKVPGTPQMQPGMVPSAAPYRHHQPSYNPQHGVQHPGHSGYPQQPHAIGGYPSYPQQPGAQFFPPQQQYPLQQQSHPYPGYSHTISHPQEARRRSVNSRDLPAPPPLPTSRRPSQEYGVPGVSLLPGQRIALEEEQKRKEQQQLGELLPGQRIALEEERRQKEHDLTGSKSDSALQQRQRSVGAYVDMAPAVALTATAVATAGGQTTKKGDSSAANRVLYV